MSHQEKQRIFDEYAKSQSNDTEDFYGLLFNEYHKIGSDRVLDHIFAACDLVQEEQQKRITENARTRTNDESTSIIVDKTSITNPENLIK